MKKTVENEKLNLLSREEAGRAGHELALWDELVAFGREESPELVERLKTVVLPQIMSKKIKGKRPTRAMKEQQQLWDDFRVLEDVNWWREQRWRKPPAEVRAAFKIVKNYLRDKSPSRREAFRTARDWKSVKPAPSSPTVRVAFDVVKEWRERGMPGRSRSFSDWLIHKMLAKEYGSNPSSVRRAYKNAERRNKEGFYASELFLRTIKIVCPPDAKSVSNSRVR